MNKKIIALSSTHGTGKSSLAYMLCAKMKLLGYNVVVLDELARRCPFEINKKSTSRTETWLICKQITEELELMSFYEYIIADRSLLDPFSYYITLWGHDDVNLVGLKEYITHHIKLYYKSIYIPDITSFDYQLDDGVRDLDRDFRKAVYENLLKLYEELDIKYKIIYNVDELYNDLFQIRRLRRI